MLTPIGIYLYNVLTMGLSNTTDIFKKCMRNIVDGLEGVINIADDVLVFATKYDKFKENVINIFDRCIEHDLLLNPEKIRINVDSVPFFKQTLTKDVSKWMLISGKSCRIGPSQKILGITKFPEICKLSSKVYIFLILGSHSRTCSKVAMNLSGLKSMIMPSRL